MTLRPCKVAADCAGELLEATQNIKLLAVNNMLSDDAMDAFNEMKEGWAHEYMAWKSQYLGFGIPPDDENEQ